MSALPLAADMLTLQVHGQHLRHIAIHAVRKPDDQLDPARLQHANRMNDVALALLGQCLMQIAPANEAAYSTAAAEPAL